MKCGKKPTFRLYLEPYFTLMIPLISLTRIENSIPSRLQKARFVSSKQLKPCSQKAGLVVITVTCSLNLMFLSGWQVGSDPEIQVATVVSNHLTAGIMKYFGDSGRYQQAANLFEKLAVKEPEVSSLLAKSYIGMSEFSFSDVDVIILQIPICRRGSQGSPNHGCSHEANASIIYLATCSV